MTVYGRLVRIFSLFAALLVSFSGCLISASAEADTLGYELKRAGASSPQQWINGELKTNAGKGAEWYVLSLCRRGSYDFSGYAASLSERLSSGTPANPVVRQRCALTMLSVGYTSRAVREICSSAAENPSKCSVMQLVFGLHLNNITGDLAAQQKLIGELINNRMISGNGWAVVKTSAQPDVDVTAMALAALAPHYSDTSVKAAVDSALRFLSAAQLENGGFKSYGTENSESCSQVIIALTALGADPETDSRFIKSGGNAVSALNGFRKPSGGFSHKENEDENEIATVQAFCAETALRCFRSGEGGFYKTKVGALTELNPEKTEPSVSSSVQSENRNAAEDNKTESTKNKPSASAVTSEETETGDAVSSPEPNTDNAVSDEGTLSEGTHEEKAPAEKRNIGYRFILPGIVLLLGAAAAVILHFKKRGTLKNYLFIGAISVILAVAAAFINIETPQQYYSSAGDGTSVTLSVSCEQLIGKNADIPQDGFIINKAEISVSEGDTVLDALNKAAGKYGLSIAQTGSGATAYISAINGIAEMDYGELSGWVYLVDGKSPDISCGAYRLKGGENIIWGYTTDGAVISDAG